ncbi:SRPBCC family protein [Amycolatopsis anabasis]|uniref:SRPBCC family protein n=1 Tax=Amycolatopsis anabasis TaxID=1840409 RepID=UPI00131AA057|nr:SRPBCC family protein [Amycolatopsis anabasis]
MTETASWLDTVTREIGTRNIAGSAGCSVRIRRNFPAPIETVWKACTTREQINLWFLPVTGDLRVGGKYQLESYAEGEILRCEAPDLLSVTMAFQGGPGEAELRLTGGSGDETVLQFEHAMVFDTAAWSAIAPEIGAAWEVALKYLDVHLRGEPIDKSTFPTPEDDELSGLCKKEWVAVIAATGVAG